jgi:hypothetical protein
MTVHYQSRHFPPISASRPRQAVQDTKNEPFMPNGQYCVPPAGGGA